MRTAKWMVLGAFYVSMMIFTQERQARSLFDDVKKIKLPQPTAKVEKFEVQRISLRDITFLFHISISNPYPVALSLDGIDLEFFIEGNTLFKTRTSKGFSIRKQGKKTNEFEMTMVYEDIIKIVKEYGDRDYLNCDIDMAIHIPLPKMKGLPKNVTLRFKLHKKVPAIKPKVEVVNFRVHPPTVGQIQKSKKNASEGLAKQIQQNYIDLFNGKKAKGFDPNDLDLIFKVSFDIIITNETRSKLEFTDLDYQFYVNKDPLIAGYTKDVKRSNNQIRLQVMNEFSSKNLTKTVIDAFKNAVGTFSLAGSTSVSFPDFVSNRPVKLQFNEDGSFKLR